MVAFNSVVDGMGFEEVNQSSQTDVISGATYYGATGSFTTIRNTTLIGISTYGSTVISGTTVKGTTISGIQLVNGSGILHSTAIDNATQLFGYRVKAGSVLMGDSCSGLISFPSAGSFTSANYFLVATPQNWTVPASTNTGSITNFMVSGIKRASGCWLYGPSGTVADWIAVGI